MPERGMDILNDKWARMGFLLTAALFFILVSAAMVLLSVANRSYGRLDVERQAAQAASVLQSWTMGISGSDPGDVMEARIDPREELPDVLEKVLGFSVFAGRDQAVFSWGEEVPGPGAIADGANRASVLPFGDLAVWERGDTVLYLKASPGGMRARGMRQPGPGGVVVLRFDGTKTLVVMYVRQAFIVMLGLTALGLLFALLWLSRRTQRLQADLDEHRALARLGTAARALAHEIRNPLSIIVMQTSLLERQLGDDRKEELRSIRDEANRIELQVRNVKRILGQGAVPSGEGTAPAFEGSPRAWLDSLLNAFPSWKGKVVLGDGIEDVPPSGFVPTIGDESLRSIVVNLVDNALDAYGSRPSGAGEGAGVSGIVAISWEFKGGTRPSVSIMVRDRAGGVRRDIRKRIFDPFFTTKPDGSGVGLNYARSLARAAEGELDYRFEPPDGSRFTLTVPGRAVPAKAERSGK